MNKILLDLAPFFFPLYYRIGVLTVDVCLLRLLRWFSEFRDLINAHHLFRNKTTHLKLLT